MLKLWHKLCKFSSSFDPCIFPIPETTKRITKYRINIFNKALVFTNLPQIIRSKHSKENMPPMVSDEYIPMVVYSLAEPIRSKI